MLSTDEVITRVLQDLQHISDLEPSKGYELVIDPKTPEEWRGLVDGLRMANFYANNLIHFIECNYQDDDGLVWDPFQAKK